MTGPQQERYIQPDSAFRHGIPWHLIAPISALCGLLFGVFSLGKTVTTQKELDTTQLAIYQKISAVEVALTRRIEPLELYKDSTSREMGDLKGQINVLSVKVTGIESGMTEMRNMFRDNLSEVKSLIRDMNARLERVQIRSGQPTPQNFLWPGEYPFLLPPGPPAVRQRDAPEHQQADRGRDGVRRVHLVEDQRLRQHDHIDLNISQVSPHAPKHRQE